MRIRRWQLIHKTAGGWQATGRRYIFRNSAVNDRILMNTCGGIAENIRQLFEGPNYLVWPVGWPLPDNPDFFSAQFQEDLVKMGVE